MAIHKHMQTNPFRAEEATLYFTYCTCLLVYDYLLASIWATFHSKSKQLYRQTAMIATNWSLKSYPLNLFDTQKSADFGHLYRFDAVYSRSQIKICTLTNRRKNFTKSEGSNCESRFFISNSNLIFNFHCPCSLSYSHISKKLTESS